MQLFLKTQAALIGGSMVDFFITWLLTDVFGCWYLVSNISGNVGGALTQFLLSSYFVFTHVQKKTLRQLLKFILMWLGNIALGSLGIFILSETTHLHYLLAKLIVSVTLGLTYTYIVSKQFVFT